MKRDYTVQPDPTGPIARAKKRLREERFGEIVGHGQVAMASALSGAPIVHLPNGHGAVSLTLGDLTMTCEVAALTEEELAQTARRYITRHGTPHAEGRFAHLVPVSASLRGQGLDPQSLLTRADGDLLAYERRAVEHMNEDHLDAVKGYAQVLLGAEAGEWRLASLDMEGLDLVRCDAAGTDFRRLWFHPPLATPNEIKSRLVDLALAARAG
ncbi:MAG: DUF2470 domain-containing protein [Pseudomonadota bacterium]